jgi:transcription elongation factor Elf1
MAKAKKKKTSKKKIVKKNSTKPKYVCRVCGTELIVTCCGVGFRKLICCGKAMEKKK